MQGFYLPGVAPRAFKDGEAVKMKVQTLVSTETPLQFDYYQLPFCEPRKIHDLPENLGEALAGEKAHTSAFKARVKVNEYCKVLCRKNYTPQQMEEFQDFAILEYRVNMRLDNLPVAEMIKFAYEDKPDKTMQIYNLGYALGGKLESDDKAAAGRKVDADTYILNNHLRFKIKYHPIENKGIVSDVVDAPEGSYIVGMFTAFTHARTHIHTNTAQGTEYVQDMIHARVLRRRALCIHYYLSLQRCWGHGCRCMESDPGNQRPRCIGRE